MCGDFNFVTSLLDRNSSSFTSIDNNYRYEWGKCQLDLGLIDAFRVTNPKRRCYTYTHTNGTSKARLDRIYVSNDLVGKIINNKIELANESDHKIVYSTLAKSIENGPGQWIFNNTLLEDDKFIQEIKEIIGSFQNNKDDYQNNITMWEFLKQNMASFAKTYSMKKSRDERKKIEEVKLKIEVLETIEEDDITPAILKTLNQLKESENSFLSKKIKGSLLRSKVPGIEEGDLNLAYYAKLEKMRAEQNTLYSLLDKNGQLVEGTEKISHVIHDFYEKLYTSEIEDEDAQNEFLSQVTVKLTQNEKEKLDEDLSLDELKRSMMDFKKNKSPGSDGLTKEFYDFFWESLCPLFFDCIKEIEVKEELSPSQKKGLIRISYKKNGRIYIENYRPITLLNVDLKILTRTLAKRMASVLPKLIHENQRCIPGRKITKNIHIVQDLIDSINKNNQKGAFIFLDQEKAFDRISHKFMLKTLESFGFGEKFIKWVKIVYTDTRSAVKVNGFLTSEFSIQRGVRQGCPLSALLYVLCAEVLGIAIRKNNKIIGYKYGRNKEHKIAQYADDMTVLITTIASIDELFKLLIKFGEATNSKLNKSKTEALWVGSWRNNSEKPLNLKWTNDKVNFTGVYVGNDRNGCSTQGFSEVFDKIKSKLAYWKGKFLSLKGKINVLNIYVLSKLWYCLECQDLPKLFKKDLDRLITDFFWKDIHQRDLEVLYRPYSDGGLNLQDADTKMKTYRIMWLADLCESDSFSIEKHLANDLIGNHRNIKGLKITYSSKKYDNNIENDFYKNAIKIWRTMNINFHPGRLQDIQRDWIYDSFLLKDDDGNMFKPPINIPAYAPEFFCDLPVTNHPREFKGTFKTLIPKLNKAFMKINYSTSNSSQFVLLVGDKIEKLSGLAFKVLYKIVLEKKAKASKVWIGKWEEDTGIEEEQWPKIWENVHNKMLNPKIQSSLWEMCHRNFMCAYFAKIAFNESSVCLLCNQEQLNRVHIFLGCDVIMECYRKFQKITDKIFYIGSLDLIERAFGLPIENKGEKRKELRNYINFSIRHIVYRNRNKVFGNSFSIIIVNLVNIIETFIHCDLRQKYDLAKARNKTSSFEDDFLIDNILGKIENEVLILKNLT